jgi:hypothetical protein
VSKSNLRVKLLAILYATAIVITSGVFTLEVIDWIGTISSSKQIDLSITDMAISSSGSELEIILNYIIFNPTSYSRIKFHYLYYQLFLNINGTEEFIGATTHFTHEQLTPHKEALFESKLYVPKAKNQYLSTHGPTSELQWRIRCVIHIETPIKKIYQTMDIYTTSSGSHF